MLIVCPSCASEYMIDPGRLGAEGRMVRCASCKETWFVSPDPAPTAMALGDEEPSRGIDDDAAGATDWSSSAFPDPADEAQDPSAEDEIASTDQRQADPKPIGEHFGVFAQRMRQFGQGPGLIVVVLLLIGSAYVLRADVVRAVPAMAALYASIGLPVNLRGLEFHGVRSELVTAGADTFLVVEGEISNISGRNAVVPPIEIGVRGAEGQMLYTWTNDPPRQTLAMNDMAPFRARLAAPPTDARQVLVRFASKRNGDVVASRAD